MGKWRKPYGGDIRWAKRQLIKRDGAICQLCHIPFENMRQITIDHIVPLSKGGPDQIENMQLAHESCNNAKGNKLPEELTVA